MSSLRVLDFHSQVPKELDAIEKKQYKQVMGKIVDLMKNPRPNDSKHLAGHPGYFRVDSGEYRACYWFDDLKVFIAAVGPRNDDDVFNTFRRRS